MNNLIELTSEDGHTILGYLAQPKKKTKAGMENLQNGVCSFRVGISTP